MGWGSGQGVAGVGSGWVRVDLNIELKSFCEIQKKKLGGGEGGSVWGSGWGGVRVDMNEEVKF